MKTSDSRCLQIHCACWFTVWRLLGLAFFSDRKPAMIYGRSRAIYNVFLPLAMSSLLISFVNCCCSWLLTIISLWTTAWGSLVVLFWLNRFSFVFRCRRQTIFNCVFNQLDHRLQHTSCRMDKTFEKVLHAMPCEYKDSFLQYNLLQRHISLHVNGACQCLVKREFEEACSPFGDLQAAAVLCSLQCSVKRKIEEKSSPFDELEAAAVLCSFRALPARYRACSYCGLPGQGGPKRLDLQLQISEFERFLHKELEKINKFFNLLHRQYIGRMKVSSWAFQQPLYNCSSSSWLFSSIPACSCSTTSWNMFYINNCIWNLSADLTY